VIISSGRKTYQEPAGLLCAQCRNTAHAPTTDHFAYQTAQRVIQKKSEKYRRQLAEGEVILTDGEKNFKTDIYINRIYFRNSSFFKIVIL
jgi:hypothetical protein